MGPKKAEKELVWLSFALEASFADVYDELLQTFEGMYQARWKTLGYEYELASRDGMWSARLTYPEPKVMKIKMAHISLFSSSYLSLHPSSSEETLDTAATEAERQSTDRRWDYDDIGQLNAHESEDAGLLVRMMIDECPPRTNVFYSERLPWPGQTAVRRKISDVLGLMMISSEESSYDEQPALAQTSVPQLESGFYSAEHKVSLPQSAEKRLWWTLKADIMQSMDEEYEELCAIGHTKKVAPSMDDYRDRIYYLTGDHFTGEDTIRNIRKARKLGQI